MRPPVGASVAYTLQGQAAAPAGAGAPSGFFVLGWGQGRSWVSLWWRLAGSPHSTHPTKGKHQRAVCPIVPGHTVGCTLGFLSHQHQHKGCPCMWRPSLPVAAPHFGAQALCLERGRERELSMVGPNLPGSLLVGTIIFVTFVLTPSIQTRTQMEAIRTIHQ